MRVKMAVASLVLLIPRAVFACPVCGLIGADENGGAYLGMTLVMSALPLLMIGGGATWLYRRAVLIDSAAPDPISGDTATAKSAGPAPCPHPNPVGTR